MTQHTLSVIVEDKPGVLARVSAMFSNRAFNIHSLAVGPTHVPGRSHITVVVDAPEMEQLKKQLHKLVNVIKVTELERSDALESEVMIARVACGPAERGEIGDTAGLFGARMIDLAQNSITFELAGTPEHLASFIDHMKPYGVMDLVKSGRVAMKKLSDVARTPVGQA
ncbi:MAG TPA: acetolactate synthase small subunit [Acidimicrobiia bacterium]|nr:acetolactate synthase small subunit [Acidimicrobiia bacterium]